MRRLLLALCLLLLGVSAGAQDFIRYYPPQIGTTSAGAFTFSGPILIPDGTVAAPSLAFASEPQLGILRSASHNLVVASGTGVWAFSTGWQTALGVRVPSTGYFGWAATDLVNSAEDTQLSRAGVATIQLGKADAAAPVAQTLQAQGVAAGTSDVAGANLTITSGNGRGSAIGSSLIFRTPTAVGGGNGAQTMTDRLTINASSSTMSTSLTVGGVISSNNSYLTAATMTAETIGRMLTTTHSYLWTNAMLTAGAAATTWDVTVATLPAKTQLLDAAVVILTAQTAAGTLSVQCGDTATFVNYVCPTGCDAKAAANTVYGDAVAERGTAIDTEFWYLPSYTATTTVTCRFISNAAMSTMTTSTGRVILTTRLLP